jgi:ribosomal protein L11 methyltransferase
VIRLALRVRREDAEIALAELLELAPSGVEEVDLGDVVEYAVYGPPGELPALPDLEAAAGDALVEVRTTEVADDWADRWRAFHKPIVVGGRLHVRPPWHEARSDLEEVVIDPGQAFGTGAHPTTKLALELMLDLQPAGSFADLGCGSGVLAIAAALLGFGPVSAVDSEPAALDATRANAAANNVTLDRVERLNLREQPPPAARTVAANLMRPLLLELARRIDEAPEALILSGLLDEEADEVVEAFAPLRERRRLSERGWSAVLLL